MSWELFARESAPVRGTVLVLEARERPFELVRVLCEIEGLAILRAVTAPAAAPLARVGRPDLILAGSRLADGPSFPVLEALRNDPSTAEIPIVGLGPAGDPEARHAFRAAGCAEVLQEPIRSARLAEALRRRIPGLSGGAPPPRPPARARIPTRSG